MVLVSEVNLGFRGISMVTDLGELLGSGLHVLDARGQAGERAGLLAVGGSRGRRRLGEEGEVPSPAFGLVGRRGGGILGRVSNCGAVSEGIRLTLVSRARSQSSNALLREAAPLRAPFLFPMVAIALLFLDVAE